MSEILTKDEINNKFEETECEDAIKLLLHLYDINSVYPVDLVYLCLSRQCHRTARLVIQYFGIKDARPRDLDSLHSRWIDPDDLRSEFEKLLRETKEEPSHDCETKERYDRETKELLHKIEELLRKNSELSRKLKHSREYEESPSRAEKILSFQRLCGGYEAWALNQIDDKYHFTAEEIKSNDGLALRRACQDSNLDVIQWLVSHFKLTKEDFPANLKFKNQENADWVNSL